MVRLPWRPAEMEDEKFAGIRIPTSWVPLATSEVRLAVVGRSFAWTPGEDKNDAVRLAARLPARSKFWTATCDGFETGLAKNPMTLKRRGNETRGTTSAV